MRKITLCREGKHIPVSAGGMAGMEHDIRVWKNNSKFGHLYLSAFWAQQLCSPNPLLLCTLVGWFWVVGFLFGFGFILFPFLHPLYTQNTASGLEHCWVLRYSRVWVRAFAKARGCWVCDPCSRRARLCGTGGGWAAPWQRTAALEPSFYCLPLDNRRIQRNLSFALQVNLRQMS